MMLKNFGRTAKTGRLKGRRKTILGHERFQDEELVGVILKHVVERAILNSLSLAQIKNAIQAFKNDDSDSLNPGYMNTAIVKVGGKDYRIPVDKLIQRAESIEVASSAAKLLEFSEKLRGEVGTSEKFESFEGATEALGQILKLKKSTDSAAATAKLESATAKLGYKARPLNGIWATAPYLHNGSVRNLTELLSPEKRKPQFHVGSTVYDVDNVGFVDDPDFPLFDATVPGNLNTGHLFGAELTPGQKADLIEYLKSL